MRYTLVLWPHANRRYFDAVTALSIAELRMIANLWDAPPEHIEARDVGRAKIIAFEHDALSEREIASLWRHSSLYTLLEGESGTQSLCAPVDMGYLPDDIVGILKYKGKTNEVFTELLLNAALFSSDDAARFDEPLTVFDPVCGRGTTLWRAAVRGYHAIGVEIDAKEVAAGVQFFEKYLEVHRLKHKKERTSLTANGKAAGVRQRFTYADRADRYKSGDTRTISWIAADARRLTGLVPAGSVDLVVGDLPYGVQHEAGGGHSKAASSLVREALPAWAATLKPGGAMALSFNSYTLSKDDIWAAMRDAGLTPCTDEPYGDFEHWVEQAIRRDIAVGVRASA